MTRWAIKWIVFIHLPIRYNTAHGVALCRQTDREWTDSKKWATCVHGCVCFLAFPIIKSNNGSMQSLSKVMATLFPNQMHQYVISYITLHISTYCANERSDLFSLVLLVSVCLWTAALNKRGTTGWHSYKYEAFIGHWGLFFYLFCHSITQNKLI